MSGIYVHIPFCRQACIYCNFYFKPGKRQAPELLKALLSEIELKRQVLPRNPETIYFGGGTPSFLDPAMIREIISALTRRGNLSSVKELTLEANPDDMSPDNLKAWKEMGISRLSVGVQSFHDKDLRWMNRAHSAAEAEKALQMAADTGFELSLDLMFGVPGSTGKVWMQNLEKAMTFNIDHLSCYGLTLEENTPWNKLIRRGDRLPADEAETAARFGDTMAFMAKQGWWHYEISNYCKPGKTALHNTAYWQGKSYVGLGPSAHSYNGSARSWNVADIAAYAGAIGEGRLAEETELLGPAEQHNEYVMTSLRTMWGCHLTRLAEFGLLSRQHLQTIDKLVGSGRLLRKGDTLFLSTEGKYYADAIAAELFAEQDF